MSKIFLLKQRYNNREQLRDGWFGVEKRGEGREGGREEGEGRDVPMRWASAG